MNNKELENLPMRINLDELYNEQNNIERFHHTCIIGSTGVGKTVLLKHLIPNLPFYNYVVLFTGARTISNNNDYSDFVYANRIILTTDNFKEEFNKTVNLITENYKRDNNFKSLIIFDDLGNKLQDNKIAHYISTARHSGVSTISLIHKYTNCSTELRNAFTHIFIKNVEEGLILFKHKELAKKISHYNGADIRKMFPVVTTISGKLNIYTCVVDIKDLDKDRVNDFLLYQSSEIKNKIIKQLKKLANEQE